MNFLLDFIDSYTQNKLEILNTIKDSRKSISFEALAHITGFEQRTIQKYVEDIRYDHKNAEINDISVIVSDDKYVQVTYENYKGYHRFVQYLIATSFSIILLQDLLLGEQLSLVQLSIEYYISDSTIKRRIQEINHHIKDYELRIISRKGMLLIDGPELQIRLFAYILFWNLYKGRTWVFQVVKREWAIAFVDTVFEQSKAIRNLSNVEEIYYTVAINKTRQIRGYPIQFSQRWLQQFFSKEFLASDKPWISDYNLTENEGLYFLLLAQTNAKFYLIKEYEEPIFLFHQTEKTLLYKSVEAFFRKFSEQIEFIDVQMKAELYKYLLSYHLFCMIFHNFSMGINNYTGGKVLVTNHPKLEKKLNRLIDELYMETKISLFQERKFLRERYALIFSMIGQVSKFEPLLLIYIDTDLPFLAEKKIIGQIKRYTEESYNIMFVNENATFSKYEVDLVLTTSYIEGFQDFISPDKIVYISENLKPEDIIRIRDNLEKLLLEKEE
ncbi:helix-turn-helix domain-containing protein [Enterococcus sp. DIV0242_7C1]|uniref:Mga helix-turn-helix domain-containing protein n=1 Tax=Candidatus Enterococcus dunnyi TaxID=1834192 RepID=A0A200JD82_9ENTE|nr:MULTISPECIES: helix-turn-helix domain-containing protein [unclassified Enterococcus]MBO0471770.1 helix-turn-helix domain-containing protein [Enterococcus sp. DIV0242_7C1]OUZ34630.1 hypothetical protein A5889_000105 [Enterococcus sp. 9D6_DIV0238]